MKKTIFSVAAAILVLACALSVGAEPVFTDVPGEAWYAGAVAAAYEKKIMEGRSADRFDPGGNITRAEFVTVLYRLAEREETAAAVSFPDVPENAWYYGYVVWGAAFGIVSGYPDGTFRPNAGVSRAEMAAILARYIEKSGARVIPDPDAVKSFPDAPSGAWYAAELETLRSSGLFKGDEKGRFNPSAPATRAEAASLFTRFDDMIKEAELYENLLPTVRLDTETGRDVESKEEYILTSFSLKAADGRDIAENEVRIRGRGNTAWRVDKKSYKLKFPSKICLTEGSDCDTKAKDWTLIACHFDRALVRNHIGYRMARALSGIEWTPYSEMVELYLNGEYRGIYMLAEQIEAKKGRVPVNDGEEETIGFLLELDFWSSGTYYVDYFKSMGHKYTIKTDFLNEDQVVAMKCHLETVYNVILEGDREKIESCVDIPSAIDVYLINEIYKETDVGTGSVYMYFKEPNGKLYFGPIWDLDGAFGNSTRQLSTSGLYAGHQISASGSYTGSEGNMWYAALMTNAWFRELAKDRWPAVRDAALSVLDEELRPILANVDVLEKNFGLWDILHTDIGGGAPPKTLKFNSCFENIVYMENWTRERIAWLDGCFGREDFVSWYPADREKLGIAPTGNTTLIEDHEKWTVPDWYERDKPVQMYLDTIYDVPEEYLEDGRIFVTLGARVTVTPENISAIVLGKYMGVDTTRYQLFFDEAQLADFREHNYGGLGGGQKTIGVLRLGVRDVLTGEESTMEEVIFTFRKDLKWKP